MRNRRIGYIVNKWPYLKFQGQRPLSLKLKVWSFVFDFARRWKRIQFLGKLYIFRWRAKSKTKDHTLGKPTHTHTSCNVWGVWRLPNLPARLLARLLGSSLACQPPVLVRKPHSSQHIGFRLQTYLFWLWNLWMGDGGRGQTKHFT